MIFTINEAVGLINKEPLGVRTDARVRWIKRYVSIEISSKPSPSDVEAISGLGTPEKELKFCNSEDIRRQVISIFFSFCRYMDYLARHETSRYQVQVRRLEPTDQKNLKFYFKLKA